MEATVVLLKVQLLSSAPEYNINIPLVAERERRITVASDYELGVLDDFPERLYRDREPEPPNRG